ncbi:3-keto-5-aminohexanoate cleavage protein [Acidimicrobium ferrooxidans]|uniref:3-keto-5-aminohexanoate cleavage protein n=1 Tax=Acidimicrobium ferrooxidans TaxID=53635 RepID=UPI000A04E743
MRTQCPDQSRVDHLVLLPHLLWGWTASPPQRKLSRPRRMLLLQTRCQRVTCFGGAYSARMLVAALNGNRAPGSDRALPLTLRELAADGVSCVRAGAGALHLHPRSTGGHYAEQPRRLHPGRSRRWQGVSGPFWIVYERHTGREHPR